MEQLGQNRDIVVAARAVAERAGIQRRALDPRKGDKPAAMK